MHYSDFLNIFSWFLTKKLWKLVFSNRQCMFMNPELLTKTQFGRNSCLILSHLYPLLKAWGTLISVSFTGQISKHVTVGVRIIILISHGERLRDLPQVKQQTRHGAERGAFPCWSQHGALWSLLCDQKVGLQTDNLSLVLRWDWYTWFWKRQWQ